MNEEETWKILDRFFNQSGAGDCPNSLVRHQIESMNEFLDKKLIQIIQGFNPIQVYHNFSQDISDFKYKINLNILNPSLTKPIYQTTDGSQILMTPNIARMNNLTYSSNLYVDIHVITEIVNDDGITERKETNIPSICIAKIPIMVRSKACLLTQIPGIAEGEGKYECRYDFGGYFIINGNEKVIISQDRINENRTVVFAPNGNDDGLSAEIRSMPDGMFLPPKTTSLHLSGKSNHMGNVIRLSASFLKADVPLFVMFRALGIESDKEIYSHIVLNIDDPKQQRLVQHLSACAEDAYDIHTQEDAFAILLKILGTTGTPKEYLENKKYAIGILKNTIKNDFLSHVGHSYKKKALYLGFMTKKLLSIQLGYQSYDNRDSYLHKRIDTPGILFSNLFRQCYGKLIKEVRTLIVRELTLWRANPNIPLNLINENNIHRFFKQSIIETGLRYALSTGNWGVKTIGSFQNIRQGVGQVLSRMSHLSTLSHLRRINTPMEKNGKLVQPRKLENSQYGMICPNECFDPETPILLWSGIIKKAKDIIVDDYLIDDTGNRIRVKSTCSGYKTMYEIIPTKKNFMTYTVTDNHILTLKARNYTSNPTNRNKKYIFRWFDEKQLKYVSKSFNTKEELEDFQSKIHDIIDITIEKYLSLPIDVQKALYTFKSDGINWEFKEVELDPYILGMWLGDGLSCGYAFATADKELMDKWIEWGVDNDATIKKGLKYKYGISSTINNTQDGIACNKTEKAPLKKILEKYDLVKNKHIPLDYLVNDRKTRLAVLAGIVDTDGNVRANGHEIRICQGEKNYKIIYDTQFLAISLGFSCHLNDGTSSYTVNGEKRQKPYKELTITGQYLYEIPTVLPRKKLNKFDNPITIKRCSSFLQSSFKLVQKDIQPFVGWQVEGTGRFLLGDGSTTHNTPEGASVGLVKNIALSTHISINVSSIFVRTTLQELGTNLYGDHITDPINFLKRMGDEKSVHIMINGDIIGFHENPSQLYDELKHMKRYGTIPSMTAIVWDVQWNIISMSTEAGRMYRPLYIVDNQKLRIDNIINEQNTTIDEFIKDKVFQNFIAPMSDHTSEGFIEYMDNDEIDKAMIAMFPHYLNRGIKGTTMPPKFTHCEIHSSLLNGVLAANIPFMDHNQAPRNCYQCLWIEETVRMSDGTLKAIKDVNIGDEVMCFDPKTLQMYNTKVVYQYVRITTKSMYKISTISGRSIIATFDHKFITKIGDSPPEWMDVQSYMIKKDARLAIYFNTIPLDNTVSVVQEITKTLNNDDKHISIIARLAGYIWSSGDIRFKSTTDQIKFNDDVKFLGFEDSRDNNFIIMMNELGVFLDNFPEWILTCSTHTKREFYAGFISNTYTYDKLDKIKSSSLLSDMAIFSDVSIIELYGYPYSTSKNSVEIVKAEYYKYSKYMKQDRDIKIMTFEEWQNVVEVQNNMIWVPVFKVLTMINVPISDITVESDNHSFIGGDGFAVSNSAMGKQALGIYMTNYNSRIDTMAHILHYPQKPLVSTKLSKYTYSTKMPSGINAIVAIMTYTGFNQEDSVMINKSAIDRGLFTSTYFKSYRDQCSKNHSTGEEEEFTKPIITNLSKSKVKPFNYDKLGEDGFVPKNTYVDTNDILLGKIMPNKGNESRDTSLQIKGNDDGHIDMNYCGINGDGYKFAKIRLRKYRRPVVGDKFASRMAQKGSTGMVYHHKDMPFTKDGIVPDIIMNPHAIPSRMTIGQLMECIMGKAATCIGSYGDSTPFTDCSVEGIAKILDATGYERYGNEIMYDGRTGQQMQTEIFIGPTYYQRLKHMVDDKIHGRGSNGPIILLTRQPAEGRARNGGLRYGEMERDATVAHGASLFLKERMLDVSDNFRLFVCKKCGIPAVANPEKNIYRCNECKSNADIVQTRMPYAMKLLMQELMTMNVAPRISL